jgi:hypothetical protein
LERIYFRCHYHRRWRFTIFFPGRSTNGDFNLSNEIAYVLIPTNTPQNIIDGYNEILNNPETQMDLKNLRESFGSFAERNGGKNPLEP